MIAILSIRPADVMWGTGSGKLLEDSELVKAFGGLIGMGVTTACACLAMAGLSLQFSSASTDAASSERDVNPQTQEQGRLAAAEFLIVPNTTPEGPYKRVARRLLNEARKLAARGDFEQASRLARRAGSFPGKWFAGEQSPAAFLEELESRERLQQAEQVPAHAMATGGPPSPRRLLLGGPERFSIPPLQLNTTAISVSESEDFQMPVMPILQRTRPNGRSKPLDETGFQLPVVRTPQKARPFEPLQEDDFQMPIIQTPN